MNDTKLPEYRSIRSDIERFQMWHSTPPSANYFDQEYLALNTVL